VSLREDVLRLALAELPEQERELISLRYGLDGEEPKSVREVARRFGLKEARVRKIESEARAPGAPPRDRGATRGRLAYRLLPRQRHWRDGAKGGGCYPRTSELRRQRRGGEPPVLTLTSNAAEAVKTIGEASPELANESGLRIHAEPTGERQVAFELTMVESPDEEDQVIEEAGARVFVEPEAALILEDKILDATVVGNQVQFSLNEQD